MFNICSMELFLEQKNKPGLVLQHLKQIEQSNEDFDHQAYFFKIKTNNTWCLLQRIKYSSKDVYLDISIYNPSNESFSENLIKTGTSILKNESIQKYARVVHQKENSYTFYIATKELKKNILGNKNVLYSVKKINYIFDSAECTIEHMFNHNSPIVHMTVVRQNEQDYLVVGSTYPSIKIYDLSKNQVVATLHNRFLLGSIDNTLIYAKINDRPSWGLTRWYDNRQKRLNNIPCTMYFLSDLLDKNKEKLVLDDDQKNVSIDVKRTEPPLINEYDDSIIFTNQFKTYNISKNIANKNPFIVNPIDDAFIYASPLKYVESLTYFLKNNNKLIAEHIALNITLDNFKKFINAKHEDLKKRVKEHHNSLRMNLNIFILVGFIEFLVQSYFEENTFINDQYIKRIAVLVAGKSNTYLIENNQKKNQNFDFNSDETFITLKSEFLRRFKDNFKNIENYDFNSSPYFSYLGNQNSINETIPKQQIAQNDDYILLLSGSKIGIIDKKINQQTICLLKDFDEIKNVEEKNSHLFVFDNLFYLIINNNLYSLTPTSIQQEKSSQIIQEKQDAININIEDLIKDLTIIIKEEKQKKASQPMQRILSKPSQPYEPVDQTQQAIEIDQPKKLLGGTDPQENVSQKGLITIEQANSIAQMIYNSINEEKFIKSIKDFIEKQTQLIVNQDQYNTIRTEAPRLAGFLSIVAIKYYIKPIINIIINDSLESILQKTNVNLDNKKDLIKDFLVTTLQDQNIWLSNLIDQKSLILKIEQEIYKITKEQIQTRFKDVTDAALNHYQNFNGLQYLYFAENNKITFTKDEPGFFLDTKKTIINDDTVFNYLKQKLFNNADNIKSNLEKNKKNFDRQLIRILQG